MFIELEQRDIERFLIHHDITRDMRCEVPLHMPNVTINTDHIVSMVEHKNLNGEFDFTEILVITGKVYKVTECISNIKEWIKR